MAAVEINIAGRRFRSEIVPSEIALEQAKAVARAERDHFEA
jgi:hypothetical protein